MKYLVIFLILIGFVGLIVPIEFTPNSYALSLGMSSEQILNTQKLVILGRVDSVETRPDKTEYTVSVLEYVKSPDEFEKKDTIMIVGCAEGQRGGCVTFGKGQYVLFVLNEGNGVLQVSEVSFVAPNPNCTVDDFFELHDAKYGLETSQNNKTKQFFTGEPIDISFYAYNKQLDDSPYKVTVEFFRANNNTVFSKTFEGKFEECVPNVKLETTFTPTDMGKYGKRYTASYGGGEMVWGVPIVEKGATPLKQFKAGVSIDNIQCRDNFVLIQKYDGTPACVKPVTKQHLIDRGWAKTVELIEIHNNLDSLKLNIVRIEDGRVSLYPENTCASIHLELLSEHDIQRYRNDEEGLDDTNVLQITADDLKEIPNIQELIYAVHSIDFPYNKYSSVYLNGSTFVEYEFFLMDKAIEKYGDSQEDYFIKLDKDYEERFTNPAKQGFSNTFEAPVIVYNDKAYSVDGTVFWTSDEHEPRRMGVYPKDTVDEDEKFVTLTDEDMKSVPKIKEVIENIGTIKESVTGFKGLPEDEWNQYREWFEQKSQVQLGTDSFRLIEYDDQLYSVGFAIC